ncbi:MAG: hypothetical protein KA169_09115 [Burkholderiaceae bacterium]|nr:hypothetical protein [Burkholderiaceae bacterium]
MKKFAIVFAAVLWSLGVEVLAHGDQIPQHGGVIAIADDLSFELVAHGAGASIYVMDHDKQADVSRLRGKLTVLNGVVKSEAELAPAGGNRLDAAVKLDKGAKAVATISLANGKAITVRFPVK